MKIIQPSDLDGVTIEVNENNQVSAKSSNNQSVGNETQVILQSLELVEDIVTFHDSWGNWVPNPMGIRIGNRSYMIDKVARIKGTGWFVFGSSQAEGN